MTGVAVGADGLARCPWALSTDAYVRYHDEEWGRTLHGDDALFERMTLEGFQSGLSWITILRKREGFRAAFAGFRIAAVAEFGPADVDRLMADTAIVRNRLKVEAALQNARAAAELGEGGLDELLWSFAPDPGGRARPAYTGLVPGDSPESKALTKALKKRGFTFVGPTTMYALMQATGMVDDHLSGCHVDLGGGTGEAAPWPPPEAHETDQAGEAEATEEAASAELAELAELAAEGTAPVPAP